MEGMRWDCYTMRHKAAKVPPHDAVPGSTFSSIKLDSVNGWNDDHDLELMNLFLDVLSDFLVSLAIECLSVVKKPTNLLDVELLHGFLS